MSRGRVSKCLSVAPERISVRYDKALKSVEKELVVSLYEWLAGTMCKDR